MHTNPDLITRELDHRVSDGIEVRLLWNPLTNRVSVTVEDERSGGCFKLDVDPEEALTAFHHPYLYASRGWTHMRSPRRTTAEARPRAAVELHARSTPHTDKTREGDKNTDKTRKPDRA